MVMRDLVPHTQAECMEAARRLVLAGLVGFTAVRCRRKVMNPDNDSEMPVAATTMPSHHSQ